MTGKGGAIRAGRAFVELFADDSKLVRGLRSAQRRIAAFARMIGSVGLALTTFGATLAGLFVAPVLAAARMQESLNAFGAVFGAETEAAAAFADELARRVGRSATDIKSAMTSFQGFFVGLGLGKRAARDFASELSALSLDFASFWNLSDAEAQQRFISALSGSAEVLDKFGVNLRVANLAPKLQEMFGVGYEGATELQKAMARLEIIRDVMGDQGAIGDATKTAGSFTNQLKRLTDGLKELSAAIGSALMSSILPWLQSINVGVTYVTELVRTHSEWVVWTLKAALAILTLGASLTAMGATLGVIAFALGGFAQALTIVGAALAILKSAVLLLLTPLGAQLAALTFLVIYTGAAGEALAWLSEQFTPLWEEAQKVFTAIKTALTRGDFAAASNVLWASLKVSWLVGTRSLTAAWLAWKKGAADVFIDLSALLSRTWVKTVSFLTDVWYQFAFGFKLAMLNSLEAAAKAWVSFQELTGGMSKQEADFARIGIGTMFSVQKQSATKDAAAAQLDRNRQTEADLDEIEANRQGAKSENQDMYDQQLEAARAALEKARAEYEASLGTANAPDDDSKDGPSLRDRIREAMERLSGGMPRGDLAMSGLGNTSGTFSSMAGRMFTSGSPVVSRLDRVITEQQKTTRAVETSGEVQ